ncbi:hypothetical protein BaRGS_00003229 [Batillaria attramentaria]|uniref:Uncharacterized protein n=1 Tax=Batillaria attramentaria TaxID=370345 RepID=A0ABD0M193_9CAEN
MPPCERFIWLTSSDIQQLSVTKTPLLRSLIKRSKEVSESSSAQPSVSNTGCQSRKTNQTRKYVEEESRSSLPHWRATMKSTIICPMAT